MDEGVKIVFLVVTFVSLFMISHAVAQSVFGGLLIRRPWNTTREMVTIRVTTAIGIAFILGILVYLGWLMSL